MSQEYWRSRRINYSNTHWIEEQRRLRETQRRREEELRKKAEEERKLKEIEATFDGAWKKLHYAGQRLEENIKHFSVFSNLPTELKLQIDKLPNVITNIDEVEKQKQQVKDIRGQIQEVKKITGEMLSLADLVSASNKNASALMIKCIDCFISQKNVTEDRTVEEKHVAAIEEIGLDIESELDTDIYIDQKATQEPNANELKNQALIQRKNSILDKLSEETDDLILSAYHKKELDRAKETIMDIGDMDQLENFRRISIELLLKKAKKYDGFHKKHYEEFHSSLAKYEILCGMASEHTNSFEFSPESMSEMKNEIARLEELVKASEEMAYIEKSIREVMEELGLAVFAHRNVSKGAGAFYRNMLFQHSDQSAVNVTFSSDGRISMEVCGICEDGEEPSDASKEALVTNIEDFCKLYPEIEDMLGKKGVLPAGERVTLPPAPMHAVFCARDDFMITNQDKVPGPVRETQINRTREKKAMRYEPI